MSSDNEQRDFLELSVYQGVLASFSEKNLHLEDKRFDLPFRSAIAGLFTIAFDRASVGSLHPMKNLIEMQRKFETRHFNHVISGTPIHFDALFGRDLRGTSWEEVQSVQMRHDVDYHPEVILPGKVHDLGHTALHIGMTNGKIADSLLKDENQIERVDSYTKIIIFAVKASTDLNINIPGNSIEFPPVIDEGQTL